MPIVLVFAEFDNVAPVDKRPPSPAELREAQERWEREYGLTSAILRRYTFRVQQIYQQRYRGFISGELIIALLWHLERTRPQYFADAVDYAHRLASRRKGNS